LSNIFITLDRNFWTRNASRHPKYQNTRIVT